MSPTNHGKWKITILETKLTKLNSFCRSLFSTSMMGERGYYYNPENTRKREHFKRKNITVVFQSAFLGGYVKFSADECFCVNQFRFPKALSQSRISVNFTSPPSKFDLQEHEVERSPQRCFESRLFCFHSFKELNP